MSTFNILYKKIINSILLTEATSNLYHLTNTGALLKISQQNAIALTFAPSTNADNKSSKYSFYFSMSRVPNGGYTMSSTYHKNTSVILQLDGNLLNQSYKISPVNYWGTEFTKIDRKYNENEDRLWSNKPFIENANKYIKSCHIYIPKEQQNEHCVDNIIEIEKLKISKIYYYNDFNAFLLLDTRKALTSPNGLLQHQAIQEPYHYKHSNKRLLQTINWLEHPDNLDNKTFYSERARYFDFHSGLSADLHNARSEKDRETQEILSRFAKILRKYDNSIKKAVDHAQKISNETYYK